MNNQGFTLLEVLVSVAIVGILAGLAIGEFTDYQNRSTLKNVTVELIADLRLAKSEATKTNQNIYVNFATGTNWCYGVNNNSNCDCATAGSCQLNSSNKSVSAADWTGVTLSSTGFSGSSFYFDASDGRVANDGSFTLTSNGETVVITIGDFGSIAACSSSISGYPAC